MTAQSPIKTAYWLVRSELYKFNKSIHQTLLDMFAPAIVNAFVAGFVLPHLGLPERWSGLVTVGELVFFSAGMMFWRFGNKWIMEYEESETVTFELTLPLPTWLVPVRLVAGWFAQSIVTNSLTIFIAKLVLGSRFDWSHISWPKVIGMYLLMNLCFSLFAGAVTFYYLSLWKSWRFWDRFMFPLTLVSIDFSWMTAYIALKPLAYLMLLLPFTYAYEGMRAAILGQQEFINYWLCCSVLAGATVMLLWFTLRIFKKKLDCV